MRHKKRLPRAPHPRSIFSRLRDGADPPEPAALRRHLSSPLFAKSRHRVRAAFVRIRRQEVVVIEVKSSLVADPFEAQLALSAIELTCGTPAVLWAYEPCGCRGLFGRREYITAIDAMSHEGLAWEYVVIDFARPALERLSPEPERGTMN